MKRFVSASNRPIINWPALLCAVVLWQFASPSASAQTPNPQQSNGGPAVSIDRLLDQTNAAINSRDYHAAVQAFRHATALGTKTAEQSARLAQLRRRFTTIGIDDALLNMPPSNSSKSIQRLPDVIDAKPIAAGPQTAALAVNLPAGLTPKQQALRLVAIGRAALDRGEVVQALTAARQAQSLKVPEQVFGPGEPRPWQLELDAESAARRRGISMAGATDANAGVPNPVQTAGGFTGPNPGLVQQMLHTADANPTNTSSGQPAAAANPIQQVQGIDPLQDGTAETEQGQQLFNAGLEALTGGDKAKALEQFRQAWKYQHQLTATQRSQLKDKLTLLQAKRLGTSAQPSTGEMSPLKQADLEKQQKIRRFYNEITSEITKAEQSKTIQPLNTLDRLQQLGRRVDESDFEEKTKFALARMVDKAITEQKQYVEANRAKIELDLQNEKIRSERESEQLRDSRIDEEVKSLVASFNKLIDEKRFPEAEVVAKQIAELRPDHPIATQVAHVSRTKSSIDIYQEIQSMKEDDFLRQMNDISRSSVMIDPNTPMVFGDERDWESISAARAGLREDRDAHLSPAERRIKQKLSTPVSIKYSNRPLSDVLQDLSATTGVPIVIDHRALGAVRVTAETPITVQQLNGISFESALNILLKQLELTHVIDNDVLEITSMESKRSRVYPVTYAVKDLVIPIPNFTSSYDDGLAGALRNAIQMTSPNQTQVQVVPVSATDLGNRMSKSMSPNYMGDDVMGQYAQMGGQTGFGMGGPQSGPAGAGGGAFADFGSLMELIQTTVAPETWESLGGPSTMQPYAQNLSLVISTTSEVHDQIVELLESLRRLQNLQITIEVRFITLADSFAEQIGVDFDVDFDDNVKELPQDDSGPSVAIGWDGIAGVPTGDLDLQLNNQSFGLAPPFGDAGLGTPSTIGFAILSDIEAFFFLQAAQADNRSNIMQAPKVTMFDGQFANIADVTQRPFVTSIIPVVGDFAVAQQPVIVVLNEGTQLNVQGIVSDDKRFVRLTLVPYFSQIGDVDTFTYEGQRTSRTRSQATTDTDGDGDIDEDDVTEESEQEDTTVGTTVQLPTLASTSVSTTVSVPDGGTILLGGIKRLAEGRNERGIPVLSKIPYVSRLFRNVSAGRDARSLMLMVTPRIIIQEEEEEAQTGFNPNDP